MDGATNAFSTFRTIKTASNDNLISAPIPAPIPAPVSVPVPASAPFAKYIMWGDRALEPIKIRSVWIDVRWFFWDYRVMMEYDESEPPIYWAIGNVMVPAQSSFKIISFVYKSKGDAEREVARLRAAASRARRFFA